MKLGRLGNPPLVFQEDAGLMGSSGVARSVDTSLGPLIDAKTGCLDVKGSCVGSLNYTEQVSEASSMRGSFVFSVDARNRLIKEAEGLSAVKLDGDFFDATDALAVAICHHYSLNKTIKPEMSVKKTKLKKGRSAWGEFVNNNKELTNIK